MTKKFPNCGMVTALQKPTGIDTWKMLATRYKNQANVIGADLKKRTSRQGKLGN